MIGQNILHYEILAKLGEGGMGEVYLAEDTKLERKVALKFLPRHLSADPKLQARFQREAKAAAALNHPNIIIVYEIGEHEGRAYIAMEYVEGHSLRELVEKDELSDNRILDIICQICEGLAYAHKAGIVHRDLKPENIMLDADGKARILDFGLARVRGKLTSERLTLGTLSYMAPEYFEGGQIDHRADLWTIGVLLYEMFTGELPFDGEYEQTVIYSIVNEAPAPLQSYCPHLSGDFQKIIDRILQKHPDDRYQFASEIAHDLHQFEAFGLLKSDANNVATQKDTDVLQPSRQALKTSISDKVHEQPKTESVARRADENPYPGLRPFSADESHLFFGREGQSRDLLKKLRRNHFVAVVGASGSGKTSLIRAGVLPLLREGFMARAGAFWRIAAFRPSNDPIGNMARALAAQDLLRVEILDHSDQATIIENILRRDNLGLLQLARQKGMSAHENLLLIVDQFEELFRFQQIAKNGNSAEEAAAFVALLLEATQQFQAPVYVVLTMRSDFLGDCPRFQGLPEAINNSQYLVPRMTREQKRAAICGPATAAGARITPQLVQRLLDDTGDNPDQLPIMQHALMRTWDYWRSEPQSNGALDLHHYETIGGMENALSLHADEAFDELAKDCPATEGQDRQTIAEKMFKFLTEKGRDNREVRRPTRLRDLVATTGADEQQIIAVIEAFRQPGRSLLTPPASEKLISDSLVDISHESLIRNWQRLKGWVEEEAQSAKIYRRLAETAILYEQKKADVYHDPDLQIAQDWYRKEKPNKTWAQRYHAGFEPAIAFLQHSDETSKAEAAAKEALRRKQLRRTQIFSAVLGGAFLVALIMGIVADSQRRRAEQKTLQANYNLTKVFEEKAGDAYDANDHQKAWLYTLAALNLAIPADSSLPISRTRFASEPLIHNAFRNIWTSPDIDSSSFSAIAFSPNDALLATGSDDGKIRLWDAAAGERIAAFDGHTDRITNVDFSPDGLRLASASWDSTVRLWDTNTQEMVGAFKGHSGRVTCVAFSPDGRYLASGSLDKTVRIWDVLKGEIVGEPKIHTHVILCVAFSPDGKHLAFGSQEKTLRLLDMATGKNIAVFKGHTSNISSIAFSPDGRLLASGSSDNTMRLWNVSTGKFMTEIAGHATSVNDVAFSPDGRYLVSCSADQTIRFWNTVNWKSAAFARGHASSALGMAFSFDGGHLATFSANKVRMWDVFIESAVRVLEGHANKIYDIAISSDGRYLASGSLDGTARLWDARTGETTAELKGHSLFVVTLAFSPDGTRLATGSGDRTVRLWDVATGKELIRLADHTNTVFALAFSPDGARLATSSADHTMRLWNVTTGEMIFQFEGDTKSVRSVVFSPDGSRLAAGSHAELTRFWDAATGKLITHFEEGTKHARSIAFSPDGTLLASTASKDNTVKLWNVDTGENVFVLKGHSNDILNVAFSPDGKRLASASLDNTARLWNVATGEPVAELKGHTNTVWGVAFSPDGRYLASCSADKTIRLWDIRQRQMPEGLEEFAKIYEASFHLFSSRLEGLDIVTETRITGSGSSELSRWDKFQRLHCPRPLDKDPILWILENME